MSDRIHLTTDAGVELTGWALNVSRGGVRAIVEEQVDLGAHFTVSLGEAPLKRRGRVVWIQEEPDGAIVGIEFLNDAGTIGSGAPPPAPTTDGSE